MCTEINNEGKEFVNTRKKVKGESEPRCTDGSADRGVRTSGG